MKNLVRLLLISLFLISCIDSSDKLEVSIFQTSSAGDKLSLIAPTKNNENYYSKIILKPDETYQKIAGFGGAFTESSAFLLNRMSKDKRKKILNAYFSNKGAQYSLTRTHINSCDFSLSHYSYAPIAGDTALVNFSINEDKEDIIPMIQEAQKISKEGFKIVASPWTAPPWMKDNNSWLGGKLMDKYYSTWALYFSKYVQAYAEQGIDIWALTVENEPLGNGENWESMHYTSKEMSNFIKNHLGPQLKKDDIKTNILVYDQNKGEELNRWASTLLLDKELSPFIYGTAVHWYSGTVDWFPESLNNTHKLAPNKHIIATEACVDSEVPHWQDDTWYWSKEATDWGFDWASEENKHNHPKYVPVYRYARDIIGSLNNSVEGWIDWNMVLDTNGGPNWAKNWCVAPIIVDPKKDEVYYTPLYYTLSHFSKFIRPKAVRIGVEINDEELMVTAVKNIDNSIAVIVFNPNAESKNIELILNGERIKIKIAKEALQSIIIND